MAVKLGKTEIFLGVACLHHCHHARRAQEPSYLCYKNGCVQKLLENLWAAWRKAMTHTRHGWKSDVYWEKRWNCTHRMKPTRLSGRSFSHRAIQAGCGITVHARTSDLYLFPVVGCSICMSTCGSRLSAAHPVKVWKLCYQTIWAELFITSAFLLAVCLQNGQ